MPLLIIVFWLFFFFLSGELFYRSINSSSHCAIASPQNKKQKDRLTNERKQTAQRAQKTISQKRTSTSQIPRQNIAVYKLGQEYGLLVNRIDRLDRKVDGVASLTLKSTTVIIAAVAVVFTAFNIVLSFIISFFLKRSNSIRKRSKRDKKDITRMKIDVESLYKKTNHVVRCNTIVQNEISRNTAATNIDYIRKNYSEKTDGDQCDVRQSHLINYLDKLDRYKWGVANSISLDGVLRKRALHTISTLQLEFPTAPKFLGTLFDEVFKEEEYAIERKIIMIGLGKL
jgi:hypothetical protein